jgi:hypothetical protein
MSDPDDRDLSAAFDDLHAPRSTANYAERVPSIEAVGTVYARRWPQALATVLAVVVALGGAGTLLALRNARQGGVGSVAGYPSARTNAAMAFDSTTGLTVMYGGVSASGSTLADTWTWDGSSWATSTGPSPGKLTGAHMSDDPPDGGVLLIGVPQPANQGTGVICAVGGFGGGGTGTANGSTGTVAPSTPGGALGSPRSLTPTKSGGPVATTLPPVTSSSPITACPTPAPYPTLQTWLFTARGWTHVAGSTSAAVNADTPSAASQLAYDSGSGQVIAVSSNAISFCGPPLRSGAAISPDLVCPLAGAAQNGSTATTPCSPSACTSFPCRLSAGVSSCPPFSSTISTWTWAHGQWTQRKGAIIPGSNTGVAFGDAASAHATLVTETTSFTSPCVPQGAPCPALPSATTSVYRWVGSAWSQSANAVSGPAGLTFAGASVASVGSRAILLTASGQLYSWSAADASWMRQAAFAQPDGRTGAALAGGPGGSIVLFGGVSISKAGAAVIANGRSAGADTWTWNGSIWRHVAGTSPPPVTSPSPCSDVTGLGANACAPPPGRVVPPVTPQTSAVPKASVPAGT